MDWAARASPSTSKPRPAAPSWWLTGRNGRGKSTILDNMTPYPVMPSRAGSDGLGAFSYYDEVYLPENHKELEWAMDGVRSIRRCRRRWSRAGMPSVLASDYRCDTSSSSDVQHC